MENKLDKVLFVDIETTSLCIYETKIVQLGLIYEDAESVSERSILINPGIPIPAASTNIHKITDEMVKSSPSFCDISDKLKTLIDKSDYIVSYNGINFDLPILKYEFLRCGIDIKFPHIVDVYKLWNQVEKRKLKDAYKRFVDKDIVGAHDAIVDIRSTRLVFRNMMETYNFNISDCIGI